MRSQGTDCIDFVNSTLAVVYIPFSTITSFSYTSYTYSAIPKLYSLLDVTSMDAAGITAAGELPVLKQSGGRSSYWICGYRDPLYGSSVSERGWEYQNHWDMGPDTPAVF